MDHLKTVEKYMKILFSGGDLEELKQIFTVDLHFKGPLFQFESADSYLKSLLADPPIGFHFEMINTFANDSTVCIVYNFSKGELHTPMVQVFDFRNELICSIRLIFDSKIFT